MTSGSLGDYLLDGHVRMMVGLTVCGGYRLARVRQHLVADS